MFPLNSRPHRTWRAPKVLVAAGCLTLLVAPATTGSAFAAGPEHAATSRQALPRQLAQGVREVRRADRRLVVSARALIRCEHANVWQPAPCAPLRRVVQADGARLAAAQSFMASAAARVPASHRGAKMSASLRARAPRISAVGNTITWKPVAGATHYLMQRKTTGQAVQVSVVAATSVVPAPQPGATVEYRVRSATPLSNWSRVVGIQYPYPAPPPHAAQPDPEAAPVLTVSGDTLTWKEVAGVTSYVLVRKPAGLPAEYSAVSGMSTTPVASPGLTVKYSVRTAVEGSAWATEVSIAYPAPPPVEEPIAVEPAPTSKAIIGLVGGSGWGPAIAKKVIAAGFVSERLEAGSPWTTLKESYENGFRNDQVIVGNTPDETKLSAVEITPWVAKTLEQVKEAASYNYTLLEVGNEMYAKGGQAEPVRYAEMYMALTQAVERAGIHGVTLIFDSFGDYKTASGEESLLAAGRGWLGDALKAEPALKTLVPAFSSHPYCLPGVKYDGHDWGIEGLEAQRADAVTLGFAHPDYYATEYGEEDQSPGAANPQQQAEHIKWAYEELLSQPYVKGIWYYQLHDDGTGHWGLVSGSYEPRPALAVVEGFLHQSL